MTASPWWEAAFTAQYQELYAHRDDCAAATEVTGLLPRLRTAPGPTLDACCGNGRHLTALRAAGIPAFAFDLSGDLLATAAMRTECVGRLVRCDMRRPALASGWGAVLMLFTAFGYFDSIGNATCLTALARLLAPGGWLLLDQPEPEHLRRTLVPRSTRILADGTQVDEERRTCAGRVEKTVLIAAAGQPAHRYTESVQLYSADELARLGATAGITLVETWPSLRGPQHDDHRLVCWFRR